MAGDFAHTGSSTRGVGQLKASNAWQKRRAARATASIATDATDLAELLDMLGLKPADGKAKPHARP